MTGAAAMLAVTGAATLLMVQDLPLPEKITLLSLLAFVIGSVVWLLKGIGGRLVDSIDANTTTMAARIDTNTRTLADLVVELRTLTEQNIAFQAINSEKHADYAREREKAVAELKETIRDAMERARQRGR